MESRAGNLEPMCPRCGYDQSGEAAAWTDRCPVSGVCPECGHGFEWADLFDPERVDIRWYVGHGRSHGGRVRRTVPTGLRMVLPWVFWSRIGVRVRPDGRVLVLWLVVMAVLLHLLVWPVLSLLFAGMDRVSGLSYTEFKELMAGMDTRQAVDAALNGLVWPLGFVSNMRINWGANIYGSSGMVSAWRVPIGFGLTWFLVLTALPVTRRMAKLRVSHLVRAFVLQMTAVVVGFTMIRVLYPVEWIIGGSAPGMIMAAVYLSVCVWSLVWWIAALRSGWGIRSWGLLILGTVAAFVGGLVAVSIEDSIWYVFVR